MIRNLFVLALTILLMLFGLFTIFSCHERTSTREKGQQGKPDDQKNINADTSTIYRIGSISKTITAYDASYTVELQGNILLNSLVRANK